jgi:hypothetical protein
MEDGPSGTWQETLHGGSFRGLTEKQKGFPSRCGPEISRREWQCRKKECKHE